MDDTNDITIICERYTSTTFKGWTDGPKYVFDTTNLADKVELDRIVSVFTVRNEEALKIEMDRIVPGSAGTYYFINDERMAGVAKKFRPDLDIRLLLL